MSLAPVAWRALLLLAASKTAIHSAHQALYIYRRPRAPWPDIWRALRFFV